MASAEPSLVFSAERGPAKAPLAGALTELSPLRKCLKTALLHGRTRLIVMAYFVLTAGIKALFH